MNSKPRSTSAPRRVLAVSSPGGHFTQLQLLSRAWDDCEVAYACVGGELAPLVGAARYYSIPEASRSRPWLLLASAWRTLLILLRERPDIVVTTGAAPGLVAVALGRLLGARTAWIDSVANVERLSLSGRLAGRVAHLWVTQWEHLSQPSGPRCAGGVL